VTPPGGREQVVATAKGGSDCTLFRGDGSKYAEAIRDVYGNIPHVAFFYPNGNLEVSQDATFSAPAYVGEDGGATVYCGNDAEDPELGSWPTAINWYMTNSIPSYLNQTYTIQSV